MRIIIDTKPTMMVGRTGALVNDPGITYNEPGVTYNDARYTYGGLYGHDTYPLVNRAADIPPTVVLFGDVGGTIQSHGTLILEAGMLIGILGNTYAQSGTIIF